VVPELEDTGKGHLVRCHLDPAERRHIFTEEVAPKL
jgi:peptide/nickel transport system ATP-binding protein